MFLTSIKASGSSTIAGEVQAKPRTVRESGSTPCQILRWGVKVPREAAAGTDVAVDGVRGEPSNAQIIDHALA